VGRSGSGSAASEAHGALIDTERPRAVAYFPRGARGSLGALRPAPFRAETHTFREVREGFEALRLTQREEENRVKGFSASRFGSSDSSGLTL